MFNREFARIERKEEFFTIELIPSTSHSDKLHFISLLTRTGSGTLALNPTHQGPEYRRNYEGFSFLFFYLFKMGRGEMFWESKEEKKKKMKGQICSYC